MPSFPEAGPGIEAGSSAPGPSLVGPAAAVDEGGDGEGEGGDAKGEEQALSVEALLAAPSTKVHPSPLFRLHGWKWNWDGGMVKEKEAARVRLEIRELLDKPTAKELAINRKFKSDGSSMREFCALGFAASIASFPG